MIGLTKSFAREAGQQGNYGECGGSGFIETEMTEVLSDAVKAGCDRTDPDETFWNHRRYCRCGSIFGIRCGWLHYRTGDLRGRRNGDVIPGRERYVKEQEIVENKR